MTAMDPGHKKNEKGTEHGSTPPESPTSLSINTGEIGIKLPGTPFAIDPTDGSLGFSFGSGLSFDFDGK